MVTLFNDEPCFPNYQHVYFHRKKSITLEVQEKITFIEYLAAILAGLAFCGFFYIVVLMLACIEYIRLIALLYDWFNNLSIQQLCICRAKRRPLPLDCDLVDDSLANSFNEGISTINSYASTSSKSYLSVLNEMITNISSI